ncbi:hypothetical protein [Azohydromonas caseinilytica]|uniref:Uncharacterized protein n=1 Tax=Azohydromonas caseinilytica TaxID=2728836 RepID=A0A848F494_9BURK|nr:hypothetical protein [Azohydromonas caseinilytica]NML13439.1 hypothetical protein [Azohydromonas caseinilytica]
MEQPLASGPDLFGFVTSLGKLDSGLSQTVTEATTPVTGTPYRLSEIEGGRKMPGAAVTTAAAWGSAWERQAPLT